METIMSKKRNQFAVILISVLAMTLFMSVFSFSEDAFAMATRLFQNLFTKLWGVAKVILPVAIVLDGIVLLLDHNEKRLGAEKVALASMLGIYALLFAISKTAGGEGSGLINETIEGLMP